MGARLTPLKRNASPGHASWTWSISTFVICPVAISRNIYPVPSMRMLMRKPSNGVTHIFSSSASREPGYFAIHHIFLVRFHRIGCSFVTQRWCCKCSSFPSREPGYFVKRHYFGSRRSSSGVGSAMIIRFRLRLTTPLSSGLVFRDRDKFRRKDGSPRSSKGMANTTRTSSWRTSSTGCTRISIA